MEKRYTVFISSTFRDLIEERQSVLKAVLELDHMPAGMELFPAADESAWQLIQDVISSSDYYVLIIGGRYGSLDQEGLGYTEKEYDYAVASGKPVIPLLHENPDNLPREKTETDEKTWTKLKAFRAKIEKRHTCVYWKSAEDLKAKVIVGLTTSVKRHPAVGWVRADQVPSDATLSDILSLRNRISELEDQLTSERTAPPKGTEHLQQGEDTFKIRVTFKARPANEILSLSDVTYTGSFGLMWNDIFGGVAPTLINEAPDSALRNAFRIFFSARAKEAYKDSKKLKGMELLDFTFNKEDTDTCIVQLRALGLIRESNRQRSVKDTQTYWTLTPYGDNTMVQLRALRKEPSPADALGELLPTATDESDVEA